MDFEKYNLKINLCECFHVVVVAMSIILSRKFYDTQVLQKYSSHFKYLEISIKNQYHKMFVYFPYMFIFYLFKVN